MGKALFKLFFCAAALSACTAKYGIDTTKWLYNAEDRVYYQLGVPYAAHPVSKTHQKLAVFVPEKYLSCRENGDGTYACSVDGNGSVNGYTPATAPVLFPVETPAYKDNPALTAYKSFAGYTDAGFVYVYAGCRGRDHGVPAGVTDLKAAIRYIRRNAGALPVSSDRFFVFGSGAGAIQSAVVGASGNSALYDPYLEDIGAPDGVGDEVAGVMALCPSESLDSANEAYEWQTGATRTGLSAERREISDGLAEAFAGYVNRLGLKGENGRVLTLIKSQKGLYRAGSYYDFIKRTVQDALNDFLNETPFPYDAGDAGVYESRDAYLAALNAKRVWVSLNGETGRYEISSLDDFAEAMTPAVRDVCAFDALDGSRDENVLFGYGDGKGAHFDRMTASVLERNVYGALFDADMERRDASGVSVPVRLNMYTPLYYLLPSYQGYGTATVAPFWRIRTGLAQSGAALTTGAELAQALKNRFDSAENVDFKTVWGQKCVEGNALPPERKIIDWIDGLLKGDKTR